MQDHFNGGEVPWEWSESFEHLLDHSGGRPAAVGGELPTEAAVRMRSFKSATWERQAECAKDGPWCGNGETAKHPMIMCWPATKPDRKAW